MLHFHKPLNCSMCWPAQDSQGNCQVALRWGWLASDIVDLDALTCPRVEPHYPRQIFWQKDLCEDGARHVGVGS